MLPENFENHIVFERLEQLNQRINEEKVRENIPLEFLSFFEAFHGYFQDRLKITIPVLVQDSQFNQIGEEINAGLQQINTFIGNKNAGHLTNASNSLHSALNRLRNLPLPFSKNDFNFSKNIVVFEKLSKEKLDLIKQETADIQKILTDLNNSVTSKEQRLEELNKLIEQKSTELNNINSQFQTEFNNIKTKNSQDIENDRQTFRNEINSDKNLFRQEIDKLKNQIDYDTTDLVEELGKKLNEARKIVNVIGNVGVTGNYQNIADEHKETANIWRVITIVFMGVFSALLVWTLVDLTSANYEWTKSVIRLIAAAALSYPATYAARESNKHRKLETLNRNLELELASLTPFIELLPEDKKQEIKVKLVEKYFGKDKSEMESSDKDSEDLSIGGFEKILKAVMPLIKK